MTKFEALLEINQEQVKNLTDYIAYCKYYFKPKKRQKFGAYLICNRDNKDIKKELKEELFEEYSFLRDKEKDIESKNKKTFEKLCKYKANDTLKDFPLNWLKYEIIGDKRLFNFGDDINIQHIKQISDVYENPEGLQEYINTLPYGSFAIHIQFELKAPYFSKDDDEFYIIQNPILKEANFKVPMIRGSSWKGALAHAFRELFVNRKSNGEEVRDTIESFLRIFGAGSDSIKTIESYLMGKKKSINEMQIKLIEFILFELSLDIDKELIENIKECKNIDCFRDIIKRCLTKKLTKSQEELPLELRTHRGRVIFYPTYFDKLSLEVINPHDRRKRAGTQPIHYEVVPKGTIGIFQLIYVPFDGMLKTEKDLRKEVKEDLKNLIEAIKILADKGIGAKTKLGWGRFEIVCLQCFRNFV